jgi:hypothetical protein
METTEMNVKSEKSVSLYSSHPTDNKHTPQRTTSPKPFTSDPPDSANVHKPQPVKNGSTLISTITTRFTFTAAMSFAWFSFHPGLERKLRFVRFL